METDKFGDLEDGPLPFKRLTAVSRENHRPSQYVQDVVDENAELVYKLWIEEKGSVYVCGKVDINMQDKVNRVNSVKSVDTVDTVPSVSTAFLHILFLDAQAS